MSFIKKIWKDRISEYPTRRNLEKSDGSSELVTVSRSEGNISQEGDAFSAENMNDLEERISNEFEALNTKFPAPDYANVVVINTTTYTVTEDGYVSLMVSKSSNGVGNALNYAGRILINDVYVWEGAITITGGSTLFPTYRSAPIPVKAGDSVQFIVGVVDALQAVFYPIRY